MCQDQRLLMTSKNAIVIIAVVVDIINTVLELTVGKQ